MSEKLKLQPNSDLDGVQNLLYTTPEGVNGNVTSAEGEKISYSRKSVERTVSRGGLQVRQIITRKGDQFFIVEVVLDNEGNEVERTDERIFDREMTQSTTRISEIFRKPYSDSETLDFNEVRRYHELLRSGENPLELVELGQELILLLNRLDSERNKLNSEIRYDEGLEIETLQLLVDDDFNMEKPEERDTLKSLQSRYRSLERELRELKEINKNLLKRLHNKISSSVEKKFTDRVSELEEEMKSIKEKIDIIIKRINDNRKKLRNINEAIASLTNDQNQVLILTESIDELLHTHKIPDIEDKQSHLDLIIHTTEQNIQARQNFAIQTYLTGVIKERTSQNPAFKNIPQAVEALSSTLTNPEEQEQMRFLLEKILLKSKSVEVLQSFSDSYSTHEMTDVIRNLLNSPDALPHSKNDSLQTPKMIELINKLLANEKALILIGGRVNVVLALNSIRDNYIKSLQIESISGYSGKPNRAVVRKGLSLIKDPVAIATLTLDSIIQKNLVNSKYEYVEYNPNILELNEIIKGIPEELQNEPIITEIIELHKILSDITPRDKNRQDEIQTKIKELAGKLNDFLAQSKVKYSIK